MRFSAISETKRIEIVRYQCSTHLSPPLSTPRPGLFLFLLPFRLLLYCSPPFGNSPEWSQLCTKVEIDCRETEFNSAPSHEFLRLRSSAFSFSAPCGCMAKISLSSFGPCLYVFDIFALLRPPLYMSMNSHRNAWIVLRIRSTAARVTRRGSGRRRRTPLWCMAFSYSIVSQLFRPSRRLWLNRTSRSQISVRRAVPHISSSRSSSSSLSPSERIILPGETIDTVLLQKD